MRPHRNKPLDNLSGSQTATQTGCPDFPLFGLGLSGPFHFLLGLDLSRLSVLPRLRSSIIRSASYAHPLQVPPLANWSAAHRRVSSGSAELAARSFRDARCAKIFVPWRGLKRFVPSPTRSIEPVFSFRLISMRTTSSSSTLPMGPPASPSGPICPIQAPVETPE